MISDNTLRIALGADGYGYELKARLQTHLENRGDVVVTDAGVQSLQGDTPYYKTAYRVGTEVARGAIHRGILVCGTGMGMCIMANKIPGVFAAVCENKEAAIKSRSINNSNILTLGGFVTSPADSIEIVDAWLSTEFTHGWEPEIQEWLRDSMGEIREIEQQIANRD